MRSCGKLLHFYSSKIVVFRCIFLEMYFEVIVMVVLSYVLKTSRKEVAVCVQIPKGP